MLIDERIYRVEVQGSGVEFILGDGRQITMPIDWLPKLQAVGPARAGHAVVSADGRRVNWPAIGETVSIERVLTRRRPE